MSIKIHYLLYSVVFGALLGWFFTTVVSSIYTTALPMPVAPKKVVVTQVDIGKTIDKIIEKNIFGIEVRSAVPVDDGGGATYSPLSSAKLVGIIISSDSKRGIAILNIDGESVAISLNKEKDGLKLTKLTATDATISKGGSSYTLMLERDASMVSNQTSVRTTSGGNLSIKKSEIQAEIKDLNKVLQSALISPAYDGSTFLGYRVARLKDDSPLKKLGLEVGDIITRLNGDDLKSPELLFAMLSKLDDISAINIDVIRDNNKKTIFVELQ